jgi:Zn-dependent protease
MGHYVAARQCGLNVGAPAFIPIVGAWINLKEQPRDVRTEAYVAVAGPLVGTVSAVATPRRRKTSPIMVFRCKPSSRMAAIYLALTAYLGVMTFEVHETLSAVGRVG